MVYLGQRQRATKPLAVLLDDGTGPALDVRFPSFVFSEDKRKLLLNKTFTTVLLKFAISLPPAVPDCI